MPQIFSLAYVNIFSELLALTTAGSVGDMYLTDLPSTGTNSA
jgi:hypothetical protein